jgi:hypothetical protein
MHRKNLVPSVHNMEHGRYRHCDRQSIEGDATMNGEIPAPYDDPREPPNNLMKERVDELNEITQSTITAYSTGGFAFMLVERDDRFYENTYSALADHDYRPYRHIEGTLYVKKDTTTERDLERRAEAEKERELARRDP